MKKVFRVVMIVSCMIGAAQLVSAQEGDRKAAFKNSTPEQRAAIQDSLMSKRLGLTEEQKPAVSAINLKYAQKMDPVLKSDAGKFAMYRKLKPLMEAKDKELKGALTPEQYEKYENGKKEMMEQMRQH